MKNYIITILTIFVLLTSSCSKDAYLKDYVGTYGCGNVIIEAEICKGENTNFCLNGDQVYLDESGYFRGKNYNNATVVGYFKNDSIQHYSSKNGLSVSIHYSKCAKQ